MFVGVGDVDLHLALQFARSRIRMPGLDIHPARSSRPTKHTSFLAFHGFHPRPARRGFFYARARRDRERMAQ